MKLNGPEEILFCHENEKATNHFSPLISTVALGDIFGSQRKSSPMYTRRENENNNSKWLTIFL